ncbi:MAG: adenosine deaminase, partial [Endomicrobiia bacterium]|nr:adenosine deaminase [Endomicrobiia bacterium]
MIDAKTANLLPKADLHCHLDGSVRTATIRDLAKQNGAKLPTEDLAALEKYVQVPETCRSLTEFLACFNFFYDFLKSPAAVERIAYELVADAAKENVRILEVRFAPPLQETDKFSADEVVRRALSGLAAGERDFKVKTGAILCF